MTVRYAPKFAHLKPDPDAARRIVDTLRELRASAEMIEIAEHTAQCAEQEALSEDEVDDEHESALAEHNER